MEGKKKINIKSIGAVILVLILALLFMSKSIYTYNLPNVSAIMPINGKITKQEIITGSVEWGDTTNVYTSTGGRVDKVFVETGDWVFEGDIIAELEFNREDTSGVRDKAYDIESIDREIKIAEEERDRKEILVNEGAIPRNELDQIITNLNGLALRREKAVSDYQEKRKGGFGLSGKSVKAGLFKANSKGAL